MSKEERTKDVSCAYSCCLIGAPLPSETGPVLVTVNHTLPSVLCCIWPQPKSLESKIIMPFVQNLDLLLHLVCILKKNPTINCHSNANHCNNRYHYKADLILFFFCMCLIC